MATLCTYAKNEVELNFTFNGLSKHKVGISLACKLTIWQSYIRMTLCPLNAPLNIKYILLLI
jgi:hypothetical protein